jgi:hypothetical protein
MAAGTEKAPKEATAAEITAALISLVFFIVSFPIGRKAKKFKVGARRTVLNLRAAALLTDTLVQIVPHKA